MRNKRIDITNWLGAVMLTGMTCAHAERFDFTGHYGGFDQSETMELRPDHVLYTVVNDSTGYFLDPPNDKTPLQFAGGPCRGQIEINGKQAVGFGYCLRTNPSGGRWLARWEVTPDTSRGMRGTWTLEGLSGNAAGWKGAGIWEPVQETGSGHFVQTISGWLEKPGQPGAAPAPAPAATPSTAPNQ